MGCQAGTVIIEVHIFHARRIHFRRKNESFSFRRKELVPNRGVLALDPISAE
jgi:hypothetical protein